MWTRLLWMTKQQAFDVTKINGKRHMPSLSFRRRMQVKKLFRINQLPWFFTEPITEKNPRHLPLDNQMKIKMKGVKLETIKKNLEKQEELQLQHRIEQINKRRLKGLDYVIKQLIKGYTSTTSEQSLYKDKKTQMQNQQQEQDDSDDEE